MAVTIAIVLSANLCAQERATIVLSENWHIKQLETDKPDIAALTRQAASPDKTWLSARMPAQVHDVLLQHWGTGAVFEDNFFNIVPGQKQTIAVINPAGGQAATLSALNAEPVRLEIK